MTNPTLPSPSPDDWADLYTANFSIFPLQPKTKKPLDKWERWQRERAGPAQLALWIANDATCNIGIATGSVSGLVILDLDNPTASAEAERRGLPPTVEALTPRGRHLFFAHSGAPFPNVTGSDEVGAKLPKGMDVRGDGGYVVAAGSYYIPTDKERNEGKLEGAYRWRAGCSPADISYAAMPTWLAGIHAQPMVTAVANTSSSLASKPPAHTSMGALSASMVVKSSRTDKWAQSALQSESSAVRTAPQGNRNDQLNRSAFAIAKIVAGGFLDGLSAKAELANAAIQCGLSKAEIEATINSGWDAGVREPRDGPEDRPQAKQDGSTVASAIAMPNSSDDPLGPLVSAADLANFIPEERRWLLDGWLPVGACTTLFGDGGLGKSLIAKQVATAVASGTPLFGQNTTKANVLAFYCEDDEPELARRQHAVCSVMGVPMVTLRGYLHQSRFGRESLLGTIDKRSGAFMTNGLFDAIQTKALETGARLVILDNALHLFGDNINDPGAVTRFMAVLNRLALNIDGAVLLLGHIAKSEGSQFAGTTAWSNASRNRLFLGRPEGSEGARNPDARIMRRSKSNYARSGDELTLVWHNGAFLRPEDVGPANAAQTAAEAIDNRAFLDLLGKLTAKRKPLSANRQARNYAPRVMASEPGYRSGDIQRRMVLAMGRLLSSGAIVADAPLGFRKDDRKEAFGIARAAVQSAAQCGAVIPTATGNGGVQPVFGAVQSAAQSCGSVAARCGAVEEIGGNPSGSLAAESAVQFPQTPIGSVSAPVGATNLPNNPKGKEEQLQQILARLNLNQKKPHRGMSDG